MGIGVGGLISGLDTEAIITQMMEIERRPIVRLQNDESYYQAQISSVGTLKGALSSLQSSLTTLQDASNFTAFSATSSNNGVMSVSAASTATAGTYQVEVTTLAQIQQVRSASFADSDTTVVGTGTLSVKVGSGTTIDITIDSSNNTLGGIASAINAAYTDVNASVVNDGSGNYYLTMASKSTGLANTISLTMTDSDGVNTDVAGLSSLYATPASQTLDETQVAKDAALTVNGIAVTRSSNVIEDLISGLTLTVKNTDPGNSFTVDVAENLSSVTGNVQSFIDQYNALNDTLSSLLAYDSATGTAGGLQGDAATRMIQRRLQTMLYTQVDGVTSEVNGLNKLGVSADSDGKLSLDSTVLTTALENNRTDVINFFGQTTTGKEGLAVQFDSLLEGYVSSTGLLDAKTDGLNASIKDVNDQIDQINYRLELKESAMRAQYEALETLMANFENTSGVLSGQLDSLSNLNAQIYKK